MLTIQIDKACNPEVRGNVYYQIVLPVHKQVFIDVHLKIRDEANEQTV